jgi:RNA-splicing ligase RtcB
MNWKDVKVSCGSNIIEMVEEDSTFSLPEPYKIKSKNIIPEAVEQIKEMTTVYNDNHVVIMPDYHAGKGCVIGTTMFIQDKITPNHVGKDVGCGVSLYKLKTKDIDLKLLDEKIKELIPCGMKIHHTIKNPDNEANWRQSVTDNFHFLNDKEIDRAIHSIGTLGGGNHYIEIGKDDEGNLYLSVHSGSRSLGSKVHAHYQKMAEEQSESNSDNDLKELIAKLKHQGRHKEISAFIRDYKANNIKIPNEQKYLTGDLLKEYADAVFSATYYARVNRFFMIYIIVKDILGEELDFGHIIDKPHNFLKFVGHDINPRFILRKGAQSSSKDENVIIPINMRDGIIIAKGLGNSDWNFSAPHGAGRVSSRTVAKQNTTMEEFKEMMKDVYSTTINEDTLDENPKAYKPIEEILAEIGETVDVDSIKIIKPIYNFKGGQ